MSQPAPPPGAADETAEHEAPTSVDPGEAVRPSGAAPRRPEPPRGRSLLPALALTLAVAMLAYRVAAPGRNVLEEAFATHMAARIEPGKAAFLVFGDPKT